VLLRDPWKPTEPELVQLTVFPCWSVTVIIVLLKDAKICTCAEEIVRLVFRPAVVRRAVGFVL
jgi:hypothetical protein